MISKTHHINLIIIALAILVSNNNITVLNATPITATPVIDNSIVEALAQEINQAQKRLTQPDAPVPYFIAYKITQVDVRDVTASLSHITASDHRNFVHLEVFLRVGDYDFDNTNFVLPRQISVDGNTTISLPIQTTPETARKAAWLATEQAYKEARRQYTAKQTALTKTNLSPSYSQRTPIIQTTIQKTIPLLEKKQLKHLSQEASSLFVGYNHIRESRVAYTDFVEYRWYLNTEGTRVNDSRRIRGAIAVASTQASDGEILTLFDSYYDNGQKNFFSNTLIQQKIKHMIGRLKQLQHAPVQSPYIGPVLFEDTGAADIVRYSLAPHLSGTPPPEGISPSQRDLFGALTQRIGLRITPTYLDLIDDPTLHYFATHPLIGGYKFDDEGVGAARVTIAKHGILRTLLMSRTPSLSVKQSNGHARRFILGLYSGTPTNLFLRSKKTHSKKRLYKKLISEAKSQRLPYALVIGRLEDLAITSHGERSRLELVTSLQQTNTNTIPLALEAYRLYINGKREWVRGVQLKTIPVRAWKDILMTGKKHTVVSFLATDETVSTLYLQGSTHGFAPSSGIETSIVTPSLLFKELETTQGSEYKTSMPKIPAP